MDELQPGERFAGCRIEAVAGRGGMGVVYRATQLALARRVALKVVAPEGVADRDFTDRFGREVRMAASIDHPNIVPVYGAGEEDGRLYLVMRYVDGTDLQALVRREGRIEQARAAAIVAQVAAGLDAAHASGLVHRDVKPANVLLTASSGVDHVYLTDFGLTVEVSSGTRMTTTGHWIGSVDYMAPEQLRAEPVDARTDVYALGGVLHAALTGKAPFSRTTVPQTIAAQLNDPPPRPTALAPVDPAFDAVIARALAKDPADRYRSAGDLGRAAQAAARGERVTIGERTVARGPAAPSEDPTSKVPVLMPGEDLKGKLAPRTQGDLPPRTQGDLPPRTQGDLPPRTQGDLPPRTQGDLPPRTQGDLPPRTQGDLPPRAPGEDPTSKLPPRAPGEDLEGTLPPRASRAVRSDAADAEAPAPRRGRRLKPAPPPSGAAAANGGTPAGGRRLRSAARGAGASVRGGRLPPADGVVPRPRRIPATPPPAPPPAVRPDSAPASVTEPLRCHRTRRRILLALASTFALAAAGALLGVLLNDGGGPRAVSAYLTDGEIRSAAEDFAAAYGAEDAAAMRTTLARNAQRVAPDGAQRGRQGVLAVYRRQFADADITAYDLDDVDVMAGAAGRAAGRYTVRRDGRDDIEGSVVFGVVREGGQPRIALIATQPD